ncbi:DUF29 domain-containing protein [Aphanothece sacrum]|uniref:DUF29 domain-containing protein n=1 Tax=Aphanothece sacrum FPU1 TaxID=1920663 RepID=A0A401IGN4_APHSA|nr:DUF29 domain-containing protein [Aphanothece sacrum]GBF80443.1 hypothetical protein AsFPU1_1844 [Aphanothece sacrum FPU1]GBF85524.1 hypothetical protein AsFPU3_2586 [Aphanothece sacrum FPU3]
MILPTRLSNTSLYETDYYGWLETTIEKLRSRQFSVLDLENLIEELESMGRTDLRMANSLIKQIIIHRLKLDNLPDIDPRKHWQKEINNFQEQLEDLLSSSLSAKIDLDKLYNRAKKDILVDYLIDLPQCCPYSLADLLDSQ